MKVSLIPFIGSDVRSSPRPASLVERLSLLGSPSKAGKQVETIWSPFRIAYYATGYALEWISEVNPWPLLILGLLSLFALSLTWIDGPHHQLLLEPLVNYGLYYGRWFLLGILSSIGIGSGAHTFLLFLGPHLIRHAAAREQWRTGAGLAETVAWGLGTAIGEVPPFLVSRATALTRQAAGGRHRPSRPSSSWWDRCQHAMQRFIQSTGTLGILMAASIPNPLFDLTGIACGYFLVPTGRFLLATLVGKTIKALLQAAFVIYLFSPSPQAPVWMSGWLQGWRLKLQQHVNDDQSFNIWHGLAWLMMAYFVARLLQAMAMIQAHKSL